MKHRFKWETWRQRNADIEWLLDENGVPLLDAEGQRIASYDPLGPTGRNGRQTSGFLGLLNKADYTHSWTHFLDLPPQVPVLNHGFFRYLIHAPGLQRYQGNQHQYDH